MSNGSDDNRPKIDHSALKAQGIDWGPLGRWDITKVSDDDLKNAILFVWSHSPGNFKHDAVASFLVSETNRRLTDQMRISNETSGKVSFWIAVLALIVSLASLGIAYFDYRSGNAWQEQEVSLLKQQLDLMQKSGAK